MKRFEKLFLLFMIIISIIIIKEGLGLPFISKYTIGPGFFPVIIGSGIAIISLIIIIKEFLLKNNNDKPFIELIGIKRIGIYFGAIIIVLLLSEIIGLIVTLILFMIIVFRFIEGYKWVTCIKVAVICNIIFYILFEIWLGVPLPGLII